MFFEAAQTIEANSRLIEASPKLQADAVVIAAAVDVLHAVQQLEATRPEATVAKGFADRLLVAAFASGALASSGCYRGVASHIGEIIEISLLLELFRLRPAEFEQWRTATHRLRLRQFPPHRLPGKLNKLEPRQRANRQQAYAFLLQHHLQAWPRPPGGAPGTLLQADAALLVDVSRQLSHYLAGATLNLANCLVGKIEASGSAVGRYNQRVRKLLSLLSARSGPATAPRRA